MASHDGRGAARIMKRRTGFMNALRLQADAAADRVENRNGKKSDMSEITR